MRFRTLLPQLALSVAIAIATNHWWLLLLPMLTGFLLIRQPGAFTNTDLVRELEGRIWLGNRRLSRLPWLWPRAVREQVLFSALQVDTGERIASYRSGLSRRDAPPLLGVDASCTPIRLESLEKFGHVLVLGATGSGKTELLRNLVPQLEGDCWCADYKGGIGLRDVRTFERETTNLDPMREQFWLAAMSELAAREQILGQVERTQPLFIVIDELAAALSEATAQRALDLLSRKGRGLQIHLLVASQSLSGIPRSIWTNLHNRIALAPVDLTDALQLGIDSSRTKSLRPHDAIIRTPEQIQTFWFPESERGAAQKRHEPNPLLNFARETAQNS